MVMSNHSELCPVCKGSGRYRKVIDPLGMGYKNTSIGICSYETNCHGCNGKGWVVIPDGDELYGRVTYSTIPNDLSNQNFNMQDEIDKHVTNLY